MLVVDSSVLIGYANRADSLYQRARDAVDQILTKRETVAITPYIFSEVVTVLSQRINRPTAIRFGAFLRESIDEGILTLIPTNERLERTAWEIFCTTRSKNVGYVDCAIAALAHQRKATIVSFDRDLKQLGRKLNIEVIGA